MITNDKLEKDAEKKSDIASTEKVYKVIKGSAKAIFTVVVVACLSILFISWLGMLFISWLGYLARGWDKLMIAISSDSLSATAGALISLLVIIGIGVIFVHNLRD